MLTLTVTEAKQKLEQNIVTLENYLEAFQAVFKVFEKHFLEKRRVTCAITRELERRLPLYSEVRYFARQGRIHLYFHVAGTRSPKYSVCIRLRSKTRVTEQFMLALFEKQTDLATRLGLMKAYGSTMEAELRAYHKKMYEARKLQERICHNAGLHSENGSIVERLIKNLP